MRLTTLGTGTIALAAGRGCAGHLVEADGTALLLDCGGGIAGRLAELAARGPGSPDWWTIGHVALTHFHPDHTADLITLLSAWRNGRQPRRSQPLQLLGPPGTRAFVARLAAVWGPWVAEPGFPFVVTEIAPGSSVELAAGVQLSAHRVPHTDESVAYCVEHHGRRVVYSGDCGFDAEFAAWASACDVLLLECTLPAEQAMPTHLTPERCGALAAIALPRRLVLTHLSPGLADVDVCAGVATRWSGTTVVATDGWSTVIEDMQCWS
jgi:ribonuclease BN (tRNA processing enzyme)